MQMADLLEEQVPKIAAISGGTEIDSYLVTHMCQVAMTLMTTFESEPRLVKMLKSVVKVIEKSKERIFSRDLKVMQGTLRTCLVGLNQAF